MQVVAADSDGDEATSCPPEEAIDAGDGAEEDVEERASTSSLVVVVVVADGMPLPPIGRGDAVAVLEPVVGDGAIRWGDSGACSESSSIDEALPACAWL